MKFSPSKSRVDHRFYGQFYPDLAGKDAAELDKHYRKHGKKEGRMPNWEAYVRAHPELAAFDVDFYREINTDLADMNAPEAVRHFLAHGRKEGRIANRDAWEKARVHLTDLDVAFYRAYYSDLEGLSDEAAQEHYLATGMRSGRLANVRALIQSLIIEMEPFPSDFSADGYLKANPELRPHLRRPWDPALHYMRYGRFEGRRYLAGGRKPIHTYTLDTMHTVTNRVYQTPEVVVDDTREPTVNVLVPAFDFGSISAGFFGVFQVALFIKRCGFNVRLVLHDRFDFDIDYSREKLKNYPGMEHLFDDLEVAYIGERAEPLRVSARDNCVATVWYSAYVARKIMRVCGDRKFLYLIQDYETVFHPSGTQYALADASYDFHYSALFSSKTLRDHFVAGKIGIFGKPDADSMYFNNACASVLQEKADFVAYRKAGGKKRLAFYSRPAVNRNMFELGALALMLAAQAGVFPKDEWEFIGIGLGDVVIDLGNGLKSRQMERLNLREYQNVISTFDIGFCLMASPHPSLLPFDLAGSGAVVVTNSFGVKDQAYFDELTQGVIVSPPDAEALVEALRSAVKAAEDLEKRYENALAMTFPRTWEQTFTDEHVAYVRRVFSETRA